MDPIFIPTDPTTCLPMDPLTHFSMDPFTHFSINPTMINNSTNQPQTSQTAQDVSPSPPEETKSQEAERTQSKPLSERETRFQEFRLFSKTFKVPYEKVPEDSLPVLSKDEGKQREIAKKISGKWGGEEVIEDSLKDVRVEKDEKPLKSSSEELQKEHSLKSGEEQDEDNPQNSGIEESNQGNTPTKTEATTTEHTEHEKEEQQPSSYRINLFLKR
ncbi:MAG: hypothetical protein M1831_000758 [Alyxoria varia]|nr:MAG: hypothetical protein M1831_000758 [Alyxoria varia]